MKAYLGQKPAAGGKFWRLNSDFQWENSPKIAYFPKNLADISKKPPPTSWPIWSEGGGFLTRVGTDSMEVDTNAMEIDSENVSPTPVRIPASRKKFVEKSIFQIWD